MGCDEEVFELPQRMRRRKWPRVSHVESDPPDRVTSKSVNECICLDEPAPTDVYEYRIRWECRQLGVADQSIRGLGKRTGKDEIIGLAECRFELRGLESDNPASRPRFVVPPHSFIIVNIAGRNPAANTANSVRKTSGPQTPSAMVSGGIASADDAMITPLRRPVTSAIAPHTGATTIYPRKKTENTTLTASGVPTRPM